jgi:hypothetical protein
MYNFSDAKKLHNPLGFPPLRLYFSLRLFKNTANKTLFIKEGLNSGNGKVCNEAERYQAGICAGREEMRGVQSTSLLPRGRIHIQVPKPIRVGR